MTSYSVTDAAKAADVSVRTVERWIAANADDTGRRSHIDVGAVQVPVLRIGRRWRVVAATLDAALRGESVVA